MALEMKKSSGWWYAKVRINGKYQLLNLGIAVEGVRPQSITQPGDDAFEQSRGKALREHARVMDDIQRKGNLEELSRRIIEIKTGARSEATPLSGMFQAWLDMPHDSMLTKRYVAVCRSAIRRFTDFMGIHHPRTNDLADVTREMMARFMKSEEDRGISPRTWTAVLVLIRSIFKHLQPDADAYRRYLLTARGKSGQTVHRVPFTAQELGTILETAKEDPMIHALIVVASTTAMRRGDCCRLEWESVDLAEGFITVKTSKTGETVEMPIFPLLRKELESRERTGQYVFPEAAELYEKSPDSFNVRLNRIVEQALCTERIAKKRSKDNVDVVPAPVALRKAIAVVGSIPGRAHKRAAMIRTVELYLSGKTFGEVASELGVSKSTISGHLNSLEKATGLALVRQHRVQVIKDTPQEPAMGKKAGQRLRTASVHGWHSFRTTWITLALSAGLPMELVRRVSGHTTADVVLKHYFRPGREDFRQAIMKAMPSMLTAGVVKALPAVSESEKTTALDRALEALEDCTTIEDREKQRDLVIELVRAAKAEREVGTSVESAA